MDMLGRRGLFYKNMVRKGEQVRQRIEWRQTLHQKFVIIKGRFLTSVGLVRDLPTINSLTFLSQRWQAPYAIRSQSISR